MALSCLSQHGAFFFARAGVGRNSFHHDAPLCRMKNGTQGEHLSQRASVNARHAGEMEDFPHRSRYGSLYRSCCRRVQDIELRSATVRGASQFGEGPVRRRGRAVIRTAILFAPCAALCRAPDPGFRPRGQGLGIMVARGRAFNRIATLLAPCAASHLRAPPELSCSEARHGLMDV